MKQEHMKPIILCDCNNFFVSCERLYRPDLQNRPVIVLSSNDGCVVSRSNEAKALGISMGVPFFQIENACCHYGVTVFSSNFELYHDISERVMAILGQNTPFLEKYSIDEAFLTLDLSSRSQLSKTLAYIRDQVYRWVGIPISIGAATSKTLAKLAAEYAKRHEETKGWYNLLSLSSAEKDMFLANISINDIWGVGKKFAERLIKNRIRTAKDMRDINDERILKITGVSGLKTVWELRGIPCIKIKETEVMQKSIQVSRSFGREVRNYNDLETAITYFVSSAGIRLRQEGALANEINIFIATNRFLPSYYSNSIEIAAPYPTNYTPDLIKLALTGLAQIYKDGLCYVKAGVILAKLISQNYRQEYLFEDLSKVSQGKKQTLMKVIDRINMNFRKNIITPAIFYSEPEKNWIPRSDRKSPSYTTRWEDIPSLKAGN